MNKSSSLFQKTRWRLTSWYAGVISVLLTLLGIGVYEAIIHAHRITIKQELTIVAGTLHDNLQSVLIIPEKIEPNIVVFLPSLCKVDQICSQLDSTSDYRLNPLEQGQYYIKLFDLSGKLIAISGQQPQGIPKNQQQQTWDIVKDHQGIRYLQLSYLLHTQSDQDWGYLRVGRSLKDFDNYLQTVGVILLLGLPLGVILIGFVAWWLAGLAITPIYQSYQQIQQFTADAAHELRTPLAAIRANLESTLMLSEITEQESRETLKTLNRQNKRLSALVSDLLILSRLDWHLMGNSPALLKQEKICLNDLISDVGEELASLALSGKITLETKIKVNYPLEIQGDSEKIYRLLFNIVSNGIQYTLPHGKVTVTLEHNPQFAVIIVEDTGIGIPYKEIKHIFNRFYRIDKARSRKQGGSGLGLSIAQAIAYTHHGTIHIQSEINRGTRVIIQLPM
jgi:signal transduction histidine kinase